MSVYKITNNINGKSYIGQTIHSIQDRFRVHCSIYSKGKCPAIWSAIQTHGKDNFTLELLWHEPGCSKDALDAKEIEMITVYNTLSPNGYNIMEGGHSSRHCEESRSKISKAKKKLWEEKGDEIRNRIRERGVSDETRKKMSEACIQKYRENPELKEYSKNRKGTVHTEETRVKMVEAWKRRRQDPNFRQVFINASESLKKPVYIFDESRNLIKVTASLTEAAEFIGSCKSTLTTAIKNGYLYKKKYYASYDNKPPVKETKTIYCFDAERNLVDTCSSLVELHAKTGFSASGVLKNAIKGGNLYKNQFYFSYSSTPPLIPT